MSKFTRSLLKICAAASALAPALLLGLAPTSAQAASYQVLYRFCQNSLTCPDGSTPFMQNSSLVMDASGNLYGTTSGGGVSSGGVVFQLQPPAPGQTRWKEKVLYAFCAGGGVCTDGKGPMAGLVLDNAGNLYGTTLEGGNGSNAGVIFRLKKPTSGTVWTEQVLHRFCAQGGACVDGKKPQSRLARDAQGNLFGTTATGGDAADRGVAFQLIPPSGGNSWTYQVIHHFCAVSGCADGYMPIGLTVGPDGKLYGQAAQGGSGSNSGVTYQMLPTNAARTSWNLRVLHRFCPAGGPVCAGNDGAIPYSSVLVDASGNVYGTTSLGGSANLGTVYKLAPPTSGTKWKISILHSFCTAGGTCTDGKQPNSGGTLILNGGKLFGTTTYGGNANDAGVLYELDPPVSGVAWIEKVLRRFCGGGGTCTDGAEPQTGVIANASGQLFGATSSGSDHGLIFKWSP